MKLSRNITQHLLSTILAASANAYADVQLLMQIPGIDGEYQGATFENWIELNSFSGDLGPGGCDVFYMEKPLDSTSAAVLMSTALGTLYESVTVVIRKTGSEGSPYVSSRFSLDDALIKSVSQAGSKGDDYPRETLTIAAGSLALETFHQGSDGVVSPAGQANVACGKVKTK